MIKSLLLCNIKSYYFSRFQDLPCRTACKL